jgi:hypothetical protein
MKRAAVASLALLLGLALLPGSARAHKAGGGAGESAAPAQSGPEESHEGDLEVLHEDGVVTSRYVYFLRNSKGERLELRFASAGPALQTGDRVRVKGARANQTLAVESDGGTVTLLATGPIPNTLGSQTTLVILVKFQDKPTQTYVSASAAWTTVFDAGNASSVSNFFLENSYRQTWLTGDVAGPYVIPVNSTTCDYIGIATYAKQAASNAGYNLSGYRRLVYAFPGNACGWWGLGTVGGNPSQAWINGAFENGVVAHEMGHNLGLYHSHALECGSVPLGGTCSSLEYGDMLDVMGSSTPPRHFNAVQKELLGWLGYNSSPPVTWAQASGVYALEPYEPTGSAPKALKVKTPFGDWYYVEARKSVGFDSGISSNAQNGVVIHYWTGQDPNKIYLLDMTPATTTWSDPGLVVGQSFTDSGAGITISPVWVSASGAGVNVTVASSCARANPTVTVSPAQQEGSAGTMLSYTVSVTNKDNSACGSSTFAVQATLPSDWTGSVSPATLSLAPGETASTTLKVTSPSTVSAGSYTVSPSASNTAQPTYAASTTATYSVASTGGGTGDVGTGGSDGGVTGGAGSFADGFNRADAPDLGNGWLEVRGDLSIKTGRATNALQSTIHMAVVPGLVGATQTVAASFASVDNNGGPRFGLVARYQDPQNYYMCYRQTGGSSQFRVSRVVNGAEKVLKSASVKNPSKNAFFTLGCQVQGSQITLTFDGSTKVSVSDSTFSSGSAGFLMGYASSSKAVKSHLADDFSATVE